MIHSGTKSNIMVVDVVLGFEDVYQKPYFAMDYIEEIRKANILLLPSENIREGLEPVYPELSSDFLRYLRTHRKEGMNIDIAVDDAHYHKLILHSSSVAIPTLLIREEVLEDTAECVVGFLRETARKNDRREEEMDVFVNIIVDEMDTCKKIMFSGRVSELEKALLSAIEQGFRGGRS